MTTTDTPKKMSLADLRKYEGPLWVENMSHKYVSVHQDMGRERIDFDLEPHGQPGSIDEMPKLAMSVRGFRKLVMKDELRISTDETMQEQVELQIHEQIEQEKVRQSGLLAQVQENSSSRDLEQKSCLKCGALIFQTMRSTKEGTPPLCPVHADDAHEFTPTLVADEKGNEQWKFTRPTIKE